MSILEIANQRWTKSGRTQRGAQFLWGRFFLDDGWKICFYELLIIYKLTGRALWEIGKHISRLRRVRIGTGSFIALFAHPTKSVSHFFFPIPVFKLKSFFVHWRKWDFLLDWNIWHKNTLQQVWLSEKVHRWVYMWPLQGSFYSQFGAENSKRPGVLSPKIKSTFSDLKFQFGQYFWIAEGGPYFWR